VKYRIVRKPYDLTRFIASKDYRGTYCNKSSCLDIRLDGYTLCPKHLQVHRVDTYSVEQYRGRFIKKWHVIRPNLKTIQDAEQHMISLQSETISEWKFVDGVFKQIA
jgi:hypothetical protein